MKRRIINGKTYTEFMSFKKKSSAQKTAGNMRKRVKGYGVRVIKTKGTYPYKLYTKGY